MIALNYEGRHAQLQVIAMRRRRAPIQAVRRPAPSPVPQQQSASDAFLLAVLTFGVAGAGIAAAGQWVGAL